MKHTINIQLTHNSGNRKSWWKHITSIDPSQRGGYAFGGDFLQKGENELPTGALLLHVMPCGSAKNGYQEASLFKIGSDGSLEALVENLNWRDQSITLRKKAEEYLSA
jgi:hypothetical protein